MFRSYAQNFEDVILWRALKHVENGVYVDIGAQHPRIDSVSLGFYEKGWRGVHAEPSPEYATLLRAERPDETVVESVIGTSSGPMTFYAVEGTGLSTGDRELAAKYSGEGVVVSEATVSVVSLETVLNGVDSQDIHWLKIDVEGMEGDVLESWGNCTKRPWLLCIESTYPNTQIPTHEDWEYHVLSRGYEFVYFDGLSRFYVSEDARALSKHFGPGPNVFDKFVLNRASGLVDNQPPAAPTHVVDEEAKMGAEQTEELKEISTQLKRVGDELASVAVDVSLNDAHLQTSSSCHDAESPATQNADPLTSIGQETARLSVYAGKIASQHGELSSRVGELEQKLDQSKVEYEQRLHELWLESVDLRKSRDGIVQSRSWRMTKPLRILYLSLKKQERSGAESGVAFILTKLNQFPATRRTLVKLISRAPALDRFLRRRYASAIAVPLASGQGRHLGGAVNMVQLNAPTRSVRSQVFLSRFEAAVGQRQSAA